MRANSRSFSGTLLLVLVVKVSRIFRNVSATSAVCSELCDLNQTQQLLYPSSFYVFGASDGRQFTSGESALIVAHFPVTTCQLPEPGEAGVGCIPILKVGVHQANGSRCLSIPAANSTKQVEIEYGIKFIADYTLDSLSGNYNHWVFPFNVVDGMHIAELNVISLVIPQACTVRGRVRFVHHNLIPNGSNILTPKVSIDTLPATIVSIYAGKPAGAYTRGDVISIGVEFSKSVSFTEIPSKYGTAFMSANASYTIPVGLPYLELNSQAIALLVGYEAGTSDRRKLTFLYNVGAGEFTPPDGQLDVPAGSTIQMNGGRIAALGTGVEADLTTMPLSGNLGENTPSTRFPCLSMSDHWLRFRVAELALRAKDRYHQDGGEVPSARLRS
jgi:hypothetical protein